MQVSNWGVEKSCDLDYANEIMSLFESVDYGLCDLMM